MFVQPISYSISFRQCNGLLIHFHSSCFAHLRLLYYYTLFVVVFLFGRSSASRLIETQWQISAWMGTGVEFHLLLTWMTRRARVSSLACLRAYMRPIIQSTTYTRIDMLPPLFSGKHRTMDNKVDILQKKLTRIFTTIPFHFVPFSMAENYLGARVICSLSNDL